MVQLRPKNREGKDANLAPSDHIFHRLWDVLHVHLFSNVLPEDKVRRLLQWGQDSPAIALGPVLYQGQVRACMKGKGCRTHRRFKGKQGEGVKIVIVRLQRMSIHAEVGGRNHSRYDSANEAN